MTTTREVFYGVISQGVAPHFFMEELKEVEAFDEAEEKEEADEAEEVEEEREKSCAFFGELSIEVTDTLYDVTAAEIMKCLDFGCRIFYFGYTCGFCGLCYRILTRIKQERPELDIKRVYCVRCKKDFRRFAHEDYEEVIEISPHTTSEWLTYSRDCEIVKQCSKVVFYVKARSDELYLYARLKKKKRIVNIYEKYKRKLTPCGM